MTRKMEVSKLLVIRWLIAFGKYITSCGLRCSVTVQRHRCSVNLKVSRTDGSANRLTGVGSRDAYASKIQRRLGTWPGGTRRASERGRHVSCLLHIARRWEQQGHLWPRRLLCGQGDQILVFWMIVCLVFWMFYCVLLPVYPRILTLVASSTSLHLYPRWIFILVASWSSLHLDPHCILILVAWSGLFWTVVFGLDWILL